VPHLYLILIVFMGWILFRFTDIRLGWTVFRGLFGFNGNAASDFVTVTVLQNNMFLLLLSAVACTPLPKRLSDLLTRDAVWSGCRKVLVPIVLLLLSTCALVGESYNPFLYFQF
jgi:alginate O-acetyltransferase complex protein AlgI